MNSGPPVLIFMLLPAVFVVGFCLITGLLGLISGWWGLGSRFRTTQLPPMNARRMISGRIRFVDYRSIITIGHTEEGVYLGLFPLFRFGHPPLLIPWSEIEAREVDTFFLWTVDRFTVRGGPTIALRRPLFSPEPLLPIQ